MATHTSADQAPTARISVRDRRDTALRCLRLGGIAHGQAKELSEQMLFAALNYQWGLSDLLVFINPQTREAGAGHLTATTAAGVTVLTHEDGREYSGLLDSQRLFDYALVAPEGIVILSDLFPIDCPLAFEPMRKAAIGAGKSMVAACRNDTGWFGAVAAANGDFGAFTVTNLREIMPDSVVEKVEHAHGEVAGGKTGTVIAVLDTLKNFPEELRAGSEFVENYENALCTGIVVDEKQWEKIRAFASDYLVDLAP